MPTDSAHGLDPDELDRHAGQVLPQREQMSLVAPGSASLTPAAEALPTEAQQWHGNPDDVHIL